MQKIRFTIYFALRGRGPTSNGREPIQSQSITRRLTGNEECLDPEQLRGEAKRLQEDAVQFFLAMRKFHNKPECEVTHVHAELIVSLR